ncbi:MAG: glycosyltransferase family 39 protein [Candidatus Omnitrophica bacterium]|nr:glycosyltransferase family 39 protein [Candidatus Omnitrophota bacterium]
MRNPVTDRFEIKVFLSRYGFFIFSLGFLLLAFRLLPNYGLGVDSPKNFDEGWINLNYLLTGHTPLQDQFTLTFQIHGSFFFMISDLFKRVLSDGLGWLDPVSARHAFLPILAFFFMNIFYVFLRKRTNPQTAFLTCAILLTAPHFWGHLFNNIKDIPLFVCFSLSIFSFYEWRASGFQKSLYLYGTFLAFAMALLSKLYAILIPIVLILWLILPKLTPKYLMDIPTKNFWTRRNLFHSLLGILLVLVMLALFFMPAFYPVREKMIFWEMKGRTVKRLMDYGTRSWSFLPWIQIFYVTPVLTLVATFLGLIRSFFQKPLDSLSSLMLTWFFVVMLTACTPVFPVYHGIRLFMVVLIPLCFFAIIGVTVAAAFLERISRLKKTLGIWLLGILLIGFQIAGIVQTHPYETTFFNRLAGGLKGAQEKHIPDAVDYWLTSYREAVDWINRQAPPNASLWVPGNDGVYMIRFYTFRKDLRYDFVRQLPLPKNSFLIVHPGETCWINVPTDMRRSIENELGRMVRVHQIRRQDGEILTIYYNP